MVQIDVLWSYSIGAGFATANTWQIEAQQAARKSAFDHRCFRDTLLYLACLFVPSGAFLIWSFPSWETMHVGTRDMPGWLVAGFTLTNTTQGILGFAVATWFLRRRQRYAAYLQWVLGYFSMLFVLVHGWDGTGYMRFLSSTRDDLVDWSWTTAGRWVNGDIAISLLVMGAVVVPVMIWMMVRDIERGYDISPEVRAGNRASASAAGLAASIIAMVLVGVLGLVIVASVAVRLLGPLVGVPVAAAITYVAGVGPQGIFRRHFRYFILAEPFLSPVRLGSVPESRSRA